MGEISIMKKFISFLLLFTFFTSQSAVKVHAAVTWSVTTSPDTVFDGDFYRLQYDLDYMTVAIFDNSADSLNIYVHFKTTPTVNMFNDINGSFMQLIFDYNNDAKEDVTIQLADQALKSNLVGSDTYVFQTNSSGRTNTLSCDVSAFTNIDNGSQWVGFVMSRSCMSMPSSFKVRAYAEYADDLDLGAYDWTNWSSINLPSNSSSSGSGSSSSAGVGSYALPETLANSSTQVANFSEPPNNLTSLSENLLPSTVTVVCGSGSGSGWSAETNISPALKSDGYKSVIVTNHHVIADCVASKKATIVTNSGSRYEGVLLAWNELRDVATVAIKNEVPALQWIGAEPKQGWWIGVIGSPLGKPGILTTGVISSVDTVGKTFTLTAAINPGNSGGPVFDSTGRVIGLATSKSVLASGELAEGFGTAHGTPLLCDVVIKCLIEKNPWGSTSKYLVTAGGSKTSLEQALAATIKAEEEAKLAKEAQAKAEAEAKLAKEAQAKAEAEAKLAKEAQAKAEADFRSAQRAQSIAEDGVRNAQSLLQQSEAALKAATEAKLLLEGQLIVTKELLASLNGQLTTLKSKISKICKVKPKPKGC